MENGELLIQIFSQALTHRLCSSLGDAESLALWKKFRDLSIVKYRETYARLNIHFDLYSGESQVSKQAQESALAVLSEKKIAVESQDALIVDLEAYKLGKTVIRKKDGTYVYITRDIAGAAERWEKYAFDEMIYVVANQQDLHLAQVSFYPCSFSTFFLSG